MHIYYEALYKASSLCNQTSQRREHKIFEAPPLLDPLNEKLLDHPVLIIYTSTIDNEALYKVSSLYDKPSRRSEHKIFHTSPLLDPPSIKEKLLDPPALTICTSTNDNETLYKVSSLYDKSSQRRSEHKIFHTTPLLDPP